MKADDTQLKRFLVNAAAPDERASIERRLITDEVFAEELMALEDELILDYARGELAGEERDRFEATLAGSPARRRRLGQTREWLAAMQAHAAAKPSARAAGPGATRRWLAMAAALAIVAVSGLLLLNRAVPPPPPIDAATSPAPRTVTLQLRAGATRSDSSPGNVVRVADVDHVHLVGVLGPASSGALRASLRAVGGADVAVPVDPMFTGDGPSRRIEWTVPRSAVPAGDYILTVDAAADGGGWTTVAAWFFSTVN